MFATRKSTELASPSSPLASPRSPRKFLLPLVQMRHRGPATYLLSPPEDFTSTGSDSYVSRKARRAAVSSPYRHVHSLNFPSPALSDASTPPRNNQCSSSAHHSSVHDNRINIPKAPDFLGIARELQEQSNKPVSRIPRDVVKGTSAIDENPFLVTPSSATLPRNISWKLQWRSKQVHHISKAYLNELFTSQNQSSLEVSPTETMDDHPSYLDTMYIVDDTPLGSGEHSKVLRVRDRGSKELYAVKMLRNSVQGALERKRYLSEARNMWKIERAHPNIVQLLGAWEQDGKIFMRMELCKFGSLDRILKKQKPHGGLNEKCIWRCLQDISAGLQAIHNSDVVHLDLKPENIFISSTGSLKIGDFGHSVTLPIHEADGIEGDRRYMAPELFNNICGKFSDIFSLGISLFEILSNRCGEIPGGGHDWHRMRDGSFDFIQDDAFLSESGVNSITKDYSSPSKSELLDLAKCMMQITHEERPSAGEIFLLALERGNIISSKAVSGSGGGFEGALYEPDQYLGYFALNLRIS
ncbi:hypothetical protein BGZ49_005094 [Haplosporangium sp. Z 27]|nr:hypothetical protein BGZ49_005094 [Haplosporangium sp. Z 27]